MECTFLAVGNSVERLGDDVGEDLVVAANAKAIVVLKVRLASDTKICNAGPFGNIGYRCCTTEECIDIT